MPFQGPAPIFRDLSRFWRDLREGGCRPNLKTSEADQSRCGTLATCIAPHSQQNIRLRAREYKWRRPVALDAADDQTRAGRVAMFFFFFLGASVNFVQREAVNSVQAARVQARSVRPSCSVATARFCPSLHMLYCSLRVVFFSFQNIIYVLKL